MSGRHRKELSGAYRLTTNNRMELLAVIRALQSLKKDGLDIVVYTDSKYVCDAINQGWLWGWQKKGFSGKKNADLWRELIPLLMKHKPRFMWVRGHSGNTENERCDVLATTAADGNDHLVDTFFENEQQQKEELL